MHKQQVAERRSFGGGRSGSPEGGRASLRPVAAWLFALGLCALGFLAGAAPTVSAAELSASDREHYKNAFLHFDRGNYRDARLHAERARDGLARKVIEWLDLTRSDSDAGFERARDFFEANPAWPRLSRLQRNLEAAMPWQLPDREMLGWFAAHPPATVDGVMKFAGVLIRSGREGEARGLLRETWRSGRFNREQEKNFRAIYLPMITREDSIERLDNLLWRQAEASAKELAGRLGKDYQALAEARIALNNMTPGVDGALDRVPRALSDNLGLIYDRALWRKRKDRFEDTVELLRPLKGDLPYPERWWPLYRWAAYEALDRKQPRVAYEMASRHGHDSGGPFAEGEWLAGWTALRYLNDPKTAYRHFSRLFYGSASPISQGRGAYWAAEASAAMGNSDWARQWYAASALHATSFYGQLAANRAGVPVEVAFDRHETPTKAERAAFRGSELVSVVRVLGELRQRDLQETFLRHLGQSAETPRDVTLVAELAGEIGRPDIGIWTAKQSRFDGLLLPELLFPLPFTPKSRSVEPALVLAVIRQESQFNPTALSPAGARGLMQLMPSTAKRVAQRGGLGYDESRLTGDPDYNLRIGTDYLGSLLDDFGGSHIMALAAYNAGPSRVHRWTAEHGDPRSPDVDPIEWIERIPFSETRNYVMRVLEGLVVYRHRLGTGVVELPLGPAIAEKPNTVQ